MNTNTADGPEAISFGRYDLDLETGVLRRDGEPVGLPPQPSRLLVLLASHRGRLVTRERIQDTLWPDSTLEYDQAINAAVRQIRAALGDDARNPIYVETVPRRGYRFVASIEAPTEESGGRSGEAPGSERFSRSAVLAGVVLVVAVLAAAGGSLFTSSASDAEVGVAVVPAGAASAGSPEEAYAETLTRELLAELEDLLPRRMHAVPWTWDMSYDTERGVVSRDGQELALDFAVQANVYRRGGLQEVHVTLLRLEDARQVWYRRFRHPVDEAEDGRERITAEVASVLTENLR